MINTTNPSTVLTNYTVGTSVLSVNDDSSTAFQTLQSYITILEEWFQNWIMKINPTKSLKIYLTF